MKDVLNDALNDVLNDNNWICIKASIECVVNWELNSNEYDSRKIYVFF